MSEDSQETLNKCCPSCIHKFYESNLPSDKLASGLKNSELNTDNKQSWAENGNNTIVGFLPDIISPIKPTGFDTNLKIPVGYNSRPPYYYPVWDMDPAAAGEYKPIGTNHQGEDKNYSGFLLSVGDGGKERCTDGMGNPGDETCEDSDNKVIHNNLFHCRRGGWEEDSYGKTPPRGAGPLPEDKELDTYSLYDYDWVNNKWIKKDEQYNKYGYYGTRNCTGGSSWRRGGDGEREAKHVEAECNKSGYWKNAVKRPCVGRYHERDGGIRRNEHHGTCR